MNIKRPTLISIVATAVLFSTTITIADDNLVTPALEKGIINMYLIL